MLSYATICDIIKPVLGDTKISFKIKKKAQAASNLLEGEKSIPQFHAIPNLTAQTSAVSVVGHVPPATMAKAQHKDSVLGLVIPYIRKGLNQRAQLLPKLDAKQHENICFNLID